MYISSKKVQNITKILRIIFVIVCDLFPVVQFKQSSKRPHDGEDDQLLNVMNVKFFVLISAGKETFEQINGLTYVHALQYLATVCPHVHFDDNCSKPKHL